MANILSNRVSETLSTEQLSNIKTAFQTLRDNLPFLIGLTQSERQTMAKMSTANRAFTESAINAISNNPDIFPPYISIDELRKDLVLYDQLDDIVKQANQISESLRDTQTMAGSEAYVTGLAAYKFVATAAKSGVAGAKTIYDVLKKRFEGQGVTGAEPPAATPPAAN